jgi:hypothetical protein
LFQSNGGLPSGFHYVATRRTILDQALASGGFLCAILGGGHTAASAFLSHGNVGLGLLLNVYLLAAA